MKTLFLAFAMILLVGCQSTGDLTATQSRQIETACATASAAQKVIASAIVAGKVSEASQVRIRAAAVSIAPVCGAATPPTLDSLQLQALQQAVALLATASQEK